MTDSELLKAAEDAGIVGAWETMGRFSPQSIQLHPGFWLCGRKLLRKVRPIPGLRPKTVE